MDSEKSVRERLLIPPEEATQPHSMLPLVVDLDGTLIRSNLLVETAMLFIREHPLRALEPPRWLIRGTSALKGGLASATDVDVGSLPYDERVLDLIRTQKASGRQIVLATAAHHILADRVAQHLGLFDGVIATNDTTNLAGQKKRDALVAAFGFGGFDYVGNAHDDLAIWEAAHHAYVVNARRVTEQRARKVSDVVSVLPRHFAKPADWVSALRLHQWLKNLLLFVPLFAAHRYTEAALLVEVVLAFLCFALCASSAYLLNDLLDLQDDRHHPRKKLRPFASGRLPVEYGLMAFPALLALSFALATMLPGAFAICLAIYYLTTVAYSLVLKRRVVIDVITLAGLYTLRVIGGGVAVDVPLSFWLLAFSMFMFLSLALVKRYAELFHLRSDTASGFSRVRGYVAQDLEMIASLGAASGYMAVMVLALYINDGKTTSLYTRPEVIWIACPLLLFWVSRVWMLAHRGLMNDDPIVFALTDRTSLAIATLIALGLWTAI